MADTPAWILASTVWAYWVGVGVMVGRTFHRGRRSAGLWPSLMLEKWLWLLWTPTILAWNILPALALAGVHSWEQIPVLLQSLPFNVALRYSTALISVGCLMFTIVCWRQLGRNWTLGIVPNQRNQLITNGFYSRVRHPIYAAGCLLMLCTVILFPAFPMLLVALLHSLLVLLKIAAEERFLLRVHGRSYEQYRRSTGRFFPRLRPGGN